MTRLVSFFRGKEVDEESSLVHTLALRLRISDSPRNPRYGYVVEVPVNDKPEGLFSRQRQTVDVKPNFRRGVGDPGRRLEESSVLCMGFFFLSNLACPSILRQTSVESAVSSMFKCSPLADYGHCLRINLTSFFGSHDSQWFV